MEEKKKKSNSDSSSESGSSSEEEFEHETVDDGTLDRLEAKVRANPFHFTEHLHYLAALRSAGDLTRLRTARESVAKLFPLPEGATLIIPSLTAR